MWTGRWSGVPSWRDFSSWLPEAAVSASEPTLRSLVSLEECRACVRLQEEIWGRGYGEKIPAAMLLLANRIGGLTAGAFDSDGVLQAFVFGLAGIVGGEVVHWSDTLAVRRGLRDRGLGSRLKLFQRQVLLGRGVHRMHWTFDPLQGRNAWINFTKLGAVCGEYAPDMYGETASPLHRGVGTDRLVATWQMDSERVRSRLAGEVPPLRAEMVRDVPRILAVEMREGLPVPEPPISDLSHPHLLLPVPGDVDEVMAADLSLAVLWRGVTREALGSYLRRGYEIREFVREGPTSAYLLVAPEEERAL